jgi:hypothetical protein
MIPPCSDKTQSYYLTYKEILYEAVKNNCEEFQDT